VEVGLAAGQHEGASYEWSEYGPGEEGAAASRRVLIVEDDPTTVEILRFHLAEAGFDAVTAGTVEEGWKILESEHIILAIVDIRLPGAYGGKLLEMIRNDERFARMPAMVLTGLLDPEAIEQAKRFGCEYMGKPFEPDDLIAKIRRLVHVEPMPPIPTSLMGEPDRYVKMMPVRVLLLTDSYQITGNIHVSPKQSRFSDAWETLMRDGRAFIPVTDARVSRADGSQVIASPTFMEISKTDVRGICPVDKTVVDRAYREAASGSHTRS
jgi:DNA-binding response OmpR family regulator